MIISGAYKMEVNKIGIVSTISGKESTLSVIRVNLFSTDEIKFTDY